MRREELYLTDIVKAAKAISKFIAGKEPEQFVQIFIRRSPSASHKLRYLQRTYAWIVCRLWSSVKDPDEKTAIRLAERAMTIGSTLVLAYAAQYILNPAHRYEFVRKSCRKRDASMLKVFIRKWTRFPISVTKVSRRVEVEELYMTALSNKNTEVLRVLAPRLRLCTTARDFIRVRYGKESIPNMYDYRAGIYFYVETIKGLLRKQRWEDAEILLGYDKSGGTIHPETVAEIEAKIRRQKTAAEQPAAGQPAKRRKV